MNSSPQIQMSERKAREFLDKIKKDCLSAGVWLKCEENYKDRLDLIKVELSIKIAGK